MAFKAPTYLMMLFVLASVAAVDNCFFSDHLDFIYKVPDQSGNYTSSKEYWMRMETICDFSLDTDNRITWYSSDIKLYYLHYWDAQDGEGCRANPSDEMQPYIKGAPWIIGDVDGTGFNEGTLCLVKYMIDNDNKYHDLRIQIYKMSDGDDEEDNAYRPFLLTTALALLSVAVWFV